MAQIPLLIIVGPSGVGKTTLYKMLLDEFPDFIALSVSYTTRSIRPNEKENSNYYYISNEQFDAMKEADEFLECATYVGNQYGTARREVDRIRSQGKIPMLEIEINGYKQVLATGIPLHGVFVKTDDLETLKQRLLRRGANVEKDIERRLQRSLQEMEEAKTCPFDMTLVNDTLESSYAILRKQVKEWYSHILPE